MEGADKDNASKKPGDTVGENTASTKGVETPERRNATKEVKEPGSGDAEKTEGSPVLGLMTGEEAAKSENEGTESNLSNEIPAESTIKEAIRKRAAFVKANSQYATLQLSLYVF